MTYKLLLTFLITLGLSVHTLALTAAEALERDLEPSIKTYQKNIQLFHYFFAPLENNEAPANEKKIHPLFHTKESRDQWINYLMAIRAGAFWDLNNHSTSLTNAGLGMYFALDPDSSKEFGESMVQLNVKEGMKYLSVYKPIILKKETLNLLVKEEVINKKQLTASASTLGLNSGFSRITLKNMVRVENLNFRKLVNEIFKKNQIYFVEYEYKSHLAGFCKVANQSAMVLVGAPPADQAQDTQNPPQETLATIAPLFENTLFLSVYPIDGYTEDELKWVDLFSRFKNILTEIRIKGTAAAKKLMHDNLNEEEINLLADRSYQCVRRY